MKVFCVIPAWNEEKNIFKVVEGAKKYVDEVVVVSDGSTDRTLELAREAGAVALEHFVNRFQGASLETGNQYALSNGADIIIHFDADGQMMAEDIPEMVAPIIRGEADAVFGSRFLGKETDMPWMKKNIIFPLAHLFNRVFFGVKMTDPQSGFRAMSARAWEKIKIENDDMAHTSEILAKAFKNKLRIKEVPVKIVYHHFGQKFSGGFIIIKDMLLWKMTK